MQERCAALAALLMVGWIGSALRPPNEDKPPPPVTCTIVIQPTAAPASQEPPEPAFIPLDVPLSIELQEYAAQQCALYTPPVPFAAAIAVMEHESYFDAGATHVNKDGTTDYGLMQINERAFPLLHEALGVAEIGELLDPYTNIRSGVYLLAGHMEDHQGSLNNALMGYQSGPTGARRKLARGIMETAFSREIISRAAELTGGRQICVMN